MSTPKPDWFIPVDELPINPDTGYPTPPDYVTKVNANGGAHAMGYRGMIYPNGTFSENVSAFTSETAITAKEVGLEKKRLAVRTKMEERHNEPLEDIIGNDMVLFHDEIVRNSEVSARSRIDAENFIIEQAGLGEKKGQLTQGQPVTVDGITPELAGQLRELIVLLKSGDKLELPD